MANEEHTSTGKNLHNMSLSPSPSSMSPTKKKNNFDADDIMKFLMDFKEVVANDIKAANETVTKDIKKANRENCDIIEKRITENIDQREI